jgi:hypothetical protein
MADWNNTTYPCDGNVTKWSTVSSCSDGIVTILELANCGLDGTLPPTWGGRPGLEGLNTLSVACNRIQGTYHQPGLAGPHCSSCPLTATSSQDQSLNRGAA